MSGYLVDTDWVVDVLNGREAAVRTLLELAPDGLALSLISYGELYEGAYYARQPAAALAGLETFCQGKDILPLTLSIARRFGVIRGSLSRSDRRQIGDMDLLIAATALEHDLVLLTRNLRDFRLVPGLRLFTGDEPGWFGAGH